MSYSPFDLLGNIGVALIVGTYLLLQLGRMQARGVAYPTWNAVGAALILVSLTRAFNLSAFVVELFWLVISLAGAGMALRRRRSGVNPR